MYCLFKKSNYIKSFFLIIFLSTSLIFAADSTSEDALAILDYSNLDQGDQTYQFLGYIFGTVSSDLVCSTSGCTMLIPFFFKLLNQGILIIGSSMLSYLVFMATALSAHEGEVFGKKLSTFWVPIKTTAALAFLVPTQTGYSLLQGMIIKVVLMGVALSNYLYGTLVNYAQTYKVSISVESASGQSQSTNAAVTGVNDLVKQLALANYCQAYFNSPEGNAAIPQDTLVMDTVEVDSSSSVTNSDGSVQEKYNINYGYAGSPYYCGQVSIVADDTYGQSLISIANNTLASLAPIWIEDYKSTVTTTSSNADIDLAHVNELNEIIQSMILTIQMGTFQSSNSNTITTSTYDWLDFPSKFYDLLKTPNGASNVTIHFNLVSQKYTTATASTDSIKCASGIGVFSSNVTSQVTTPEYPRPTILKNLLPSSSSNKTGNAINMIADTINNIMNANQDPLISLSKYGQELLKNAYTVLLTIFISVITIMGFSAICSAQLPNFAIGTMVAISSILSGCMSVFGFMLPTGVLLGIYLPMMPLVTFSLGVIGWFIQVIESMVAGPIIALGLIAPGQGHDGLGKLTQAIMLLANIFLRPGLMIIGAVMGAKCFALFAFYMTKSIFYAFTSLGRVSSEPWFFAMFMIYWMMYCAFMVSVAQRCYSLIYILPDKVLSWVGANTPSVGREVSEDLRNLQSETTKASESTSKELAGAVNTVNRGGSKYLKSINKL